MIRSLRTIKNILKGMYSIKQILFMTMITFLMYAYLFLYAESSSFGFGSGDMLLRIFSPFYDNGFSFQKILAYILPVLLLMMISGRYFQDEFDYRCRYTIPRTENIYLWYNMNIVSLIIISILTIAWIYLVHVIVTEIAGADPRMIQYKAFEEIYESFKNTPGNLIALYLSSYAIRIFTALILQMVLFLGFQKSQVSFAIPLALLIGNIYIPSIWMYMPFGSSNISWLMNEGENIYSAYILMILICLLIYLIGLIIVRSRKFLIRGIIVK